MGLGSFCSKDQKNGRILTLQPKALTIIGVQNGFVQDLEITQSIETENDLNEITYVFPTDNQICIYKMRFAIGDEIIEPKLKETETAKEIYKEAQQMGKTTVLASCTIPGITSIIIGNVPKNKIVKVILNCAFTSFLSNSRTILSKIPLQACDHAGSIVDLIEIPSLKIDINIRIKHVNDIFSVSANCDHSYEKIDKLSGILKISSGLITDPNLLISTEFNEDVKSQIVQCKSAKLLSLIPSFESIPSNADASMNAKKAEQKGGLFSKISDNVKSKGNQEIPLSKTEYLFLIDCSASMMGESILKAKESLLFFISRLSQVTNCSFNIICFGTYFKKLFEKCEPSNDHENIKKATSFIHNIKANLGGTEILGLLTDLFSNDINIKGKQNPCNKRQLFIVTDGEVYLREKVVSLIEEYRDYNRIFAIGLGQGADAGFLAEITETTNGRYDFVFDKPDLPFRVEEQLNLSLSEVATDAEIYIEGNEVFQMVPFPIPPLLPKTVQHIFIAQNDKDENNGGIMVSARRSNGDTLEFFVDPESNILDMKENCSIFALFAQKQLKKIEKDKDKSVKLSLESGVICHYTSYVGTSEYVSVLKTQQNTPIDEEEYHCKRSYRHSSISSTSGAKTKRDRCRKSKPSERFFCFRSKAKKKLVCEVDFPEEYSPSENEMNEGDCSTEQPEIYIPLHGESAPKKKSWDANDELTDVIRLQSREGFWDLAMSFITEKNHNKLPEIGVSFDGASIVYKRVISTVFAIAYLSKFENDNFPKWKIAKEKALVWLKRMKRTATWDEIIESVQKQITK